MGLAERLVHYRALEARRNKPLIAYVTSSRPGAAGQMAGDSVPEILRQLQVLPAGTEDLDFLIVSQGGDPTVAWRIASLLRERVKRFSVLVPQAAFSAATLLALGADEIVMHPHGNLGPVDPQIRVPRPQVEGAPPEVVQFGSEDLDALIDFARDDVGLRDQAQLVRVFELVCKEVGTVPVGVANRSAQLSMAMGEKLLNTHMHGDGEKEKARAIAQALNKNFFHHGYPVSRTEARELGLKVADADADLEALLWNIWLDMEEELQIREPFNPVAVLRGNPAAGPLFADVLQLNLPLGAPPALLQQVMQTILASALVQVPPTPFEQIAALCESARLATRYITSGSILASRLPDLQLRMNMLVERHAWTTVPLPGVP